MLVSEELLARLEGAVQQQRCFRFQVPDQHFGHLAGGHGLESQVQSTNTRSIFRVSTLAAAIWTRTTSPRRMVLFVFEPTRA